ncbi:hypothetical protein M407DRAFT_4538 [Tulasnella calospora MUT 4182]|uniref:F-box domain-containing protein n=1 Tax=Tulasnella calospora MUT 4182 TaxID=1051891 RepID=A0A0C3QT96_9AGAM|nr:hypothetical protein M407DRAFT_4538 [Tulasnella calospora MUT 4182]
MSPPPVPSLTGFAPGRVEEVLAYANVSCPLALKEILRLIFQFTERASLLAAATVSQLWSTIALNTLLRALPSIFPLLKLLAPQTWFLDATNYHESLLLSLARADWGRFRQYALRIRSVDVDYAEKADLPLDAAALVQTFHGTSPLLPNVKTITWRFINNRDCTSILPFLGPQLESLELRMAKLVDHSEQSLLMQSLLHRTPNLSVLRVASFALAHQMSSSLASFISSLPKLVRLKLPAFFLTKEVVTTIAKLPVLTQLDYSDWKQTVETYHESGMCFEFSPGLFSHLDDLAFASFPTQMAKVLQAADHVGLLRSINLDCPAYYSEREIRTVFANLASGARRLGSVQLLCSPVFDVAESSSTDSLSIDTIRPLFSCIGLGRFHLTAPHFAPLQNEDVLEMGASWPEMHSLSLCPSPLTKRNLGAPFDILSTFAKCFPNLQKLRLFFGSEVSEFDGDLHPAYQLTKLVTVGVGLSPVPRGRAQDIGFLLASLCQNPPSIESGPTGYHRGNSNTKEEMMAVIAACSEARSAMKLAFRIKSFAVRK